MGETGRLIKNTGIIAIGNMCTKAVTFLLLPLYTSILTTAEYGTVDYVTSVSFFLVPAATLLMDEAAFRFLIDCKTSEDRARVVSTALVVAATGLLLTVAICTPVLLFLHYRYSLLLLLYVLSTSALTMVSALLRGLGRTAAYSVLNFSAGALTIVLNVLFIAVLRLGVTGMLSAYVIAQLGSSVASFFGMRLWRDVNPRAVDRAAAVDMVRYAVPLIPNKVSWTIMNFSSRLIIMHSFGASASGLYAVSYKFPGVMDMVYGFFYMSWKESSARALNGEGDVGEFYRSVYRALRRFMMSVVFGMSALMPIVFRVMVAPSFREGLLYVPVLLLATYYSNISGFYGGIFTAYKDTRIMGTTTIASAVLNLALNFVTIPFLGLWGSSLSTLAAMFIVNEYRRAKVTAYVNLGNDRLWSVMTAFVLAILTVLYYLEPPYHMPAMVLLAGAYFAWSNAGIVRSVLTAIRRCIGPAFARGGRHFNG